MELTVQRLHFSDLATVGDLLVDGKFYAYTLEPPHRVDKPNCIPPGTYPLNMRYSNKHHMWVPGVEEVDGYADIEIHPGNYPHDTLGCLLVGSQYDDKAPDFIGASASTFDRLKRLLAHPVLTGPKESQVVTWELNSPSRITYVGGVKLFTP